MKFDFKDSIKQLADQEGNIIVTAKGDALVEMPSTNDTEFEVTQTKIKVECKKISSELIGEVKKQIHEYSNQMSTCLASLRDVAALPNIEGLKNSVQLDTNNYLNQSSQKFTQLIIEYWTAEKAKNLFLQEKGMTSESSDAPISTKAHYMILLSYAVIETILNVFLFNSALSMPDALMLSSAISVLNIGPAVMVGNYLRNVNGSIETRKYLAIMFLFVWGFFTIWMNTAVSVYRSYLTSQEALISNTSILSQNLINSPRVAEIFSSDAFSLFLFKMPPIKDALSMCLWLIGILAAIVACWKGYSSDEKLPELGKLNRNFNEKKEEYILFEKEVRENVASYYQKHISLIKSAQSKFESNYRDYKSAAQLITEKISDYVSKNKEIIGKYEILLKAYRNENKKWRKSPPPDYFKEINFDLEVEEDKLNFENYSKLNMDANLNDVQSLYNEKIEVLNEISSEFYNYVEKLNEQLEIKINDFHQNASQKFIKPF